MPAGSRRISPRELLLIAGPKTLAQDSSGLTNDLSSCLGYLIWKSWPQLRPSFREPQLRPFAPDCH
jgi:hypothetical protein